MQETAAGRIVTTQDPRAVPWLSIVFGYGPMMPFVAGAVLAWWFRGAIGDAFVTMTVFWGCAILLFYAGVRRGVSFRTEGGATVAQMATMLGYFCTGLAALGAIWFGWTTTALVVLVTAYAIVPVLDATAARNGEAPLFFARLRPLQIPLASVSLAALLVLRLASGSA